MNTVKYISVTKDLWFLIYQFMLFAALFFSSNILQCCISVINLYIVFGRKD